MALVITVLLADDNIIVREGVRALLSREHDIEVIAVAADYDELLAEASRTTPQVVVTDIRMPPDFRREGIEAAQMVRKRQPGTGVVILSQYDDPEYAVSLLAEGSAGYGYLLKQHVADGDQLARAVRAVATGGTSLDPTIVDALMEPVQDDSLSCADQELLAMVASGMPIKAIAVTRGVPPEAAASEVEHLAEVARQLNEHRAAMNTAILEADGTVMQFVGDAVMAVFGAPLPQPDHPAKALAAALAMHLAQDAVNRAWRNAGSPQFPIGIGLSTGQAAAAMLGSPEHLEYTLVGDTVNLAQRLQQWSQAGQTTLSESTWRALVDKPDAEELPMADVKGRARPIRAWRVGRAHDSTTTEEWAR